MGFYDSKGYYRTEGESYCNGRAIIAVRQEEANNLSKVALPPW